MDCHLGIPVMKAAVVVRMKPRMMDLPLDLTSQYDTVEMVENVRRNVSIWRRMDGPCVVGSVAPRRIDPRTMQANQARF